MIIILTFESGNKASNQIMEAIRRKHKCIIVHNRNQTKYYNHNAKVVVRWGTSAAFPLNGAIEINSGKAIIEVGNKSYCRWAMAKAGCPVPKTWYDIKDAEVPCILRPDSHSQGRQFRVINSKRDLDYHIHIKNYYISEIIDKSAEYRVHVWDGQPMITYDKNILPGELLANQAQTGRKWKVVTEQPDNHPQLERIAVESCKVMGLFTGAVDIMVDQDGKPFICEINTMPNVKTIALADLYAERILSLI